jgi:hypothetical protein
VEIINCMAQPSKFSLALSLSTPIMSLAYVSLGAIGYWSRGADVPEIIIFGTGEDAWARVAAGAILFQVRCSCLPAGPHYSAVRGDELCGHTPERDELILGDEEICRVLLPAFCKRSEWCAFLE